VAYTTLDEHHEAYAIALKEAQQQREVDMKIADTWRIPEPLSDSPATWEQSFRDEAEARPYQARARTRLGDRSLTVAPIEIHEGRWRVVGGQHTQEPQSRLVSPAWIAEALDARLTVQRRDFIEVLDVTPLPPFWERAGALKFMRPLILDSAGHSKAWPRARLDPWLGLVYEGS